MVPDVRVARQVVYVGPAAVVQHRHLTVVLVDGLHLLGKDHHLIKVVTCNLTSEFGQRKHCNSKPEFLSRLWKSLLLGLSFYARARRPGYSSTIDSDDEIRVRLG